jgi:hypothetical protein
METYLIVNHHCHRARAGGWLDCGYEEAMHVLESRATDTIEWKRTNYTVPTPNEW